MNLDQLREFIAHKQRISELEAELKKEKAAAAALEEPLIEALAEDGVDSMRVDGVTTYMHTQYWASKRDGVETEQVVDALRASGYGDLVAENYNSQTLSAVVRELIEQDEPLPEPLAEVIVSSPKTSLRIRNKA